ncbi:unnamed protein product [Pleuronectes platessa]|uniref:Uncharacterized protein n=1 Tax=Pleuronectes platessa TaxID=8262 RepID=A0A9N7VQF0_PLEPL|nr:unnamed protein product [Pleuronectes platessa]
MSFTPSSISSICLLGIIYSGIEGETKHICRLIPVQDNGGRITTKESYSLNPQRPHFPFPLSNLPLLNLFECCLCSLPGLLGIS